MTVLTTTRPTKPLAHYGQLNTTQQHGFDSAMECADSSNDVGRYDTAMCIAVIALGFHLPFFLPDSGEIVRCACPACCCDAIFDTSGPDLRTVDTTDHGLPQYQCADCTDEHPAPHED
ncbi:hypothetical protein [Streptomyces sp. NPDC056169]|uniref:hypothetical protein n=1 Tax=Streptomyces sp. NPDC056169 TaxID=3345734 RepID=UPI0035E3044A